MAKTCPSCGEDIPQGRFVCPNCKLNVHYAELHGVEAARAERRPPARQPASEQAGAILRPLLPLVG